MFGLFSEVRNGMVGRTGMIPWAFAFSEQMARAGWPAAVSDQLRQLLYLNYKTSFGRNDLTSHAYLSFACHALTVL